MKKVSVQASFFFVDAKFRLWKRIEKFGKHSSLRNVPGEARRGEARKLRTIKKPKGVVSRRLRKRLTEKIAGSTREKSLRTVPITLHSRTVVALRIRR